MKRILSLLLALATVLSLTACGKKGGEVVSDDGRPVLTIGVGMSAKVTWEDNWFTKYMEDRLGCKIELKFFSAEKTERKQQMTTMIAAGEKLPDILYGFNLNKEEIFIYGQDGYLMDLAPYFDDPDWELAKKYRWHEQMLEYHGQETHDYALNAYRDPYGALYSWPSCYSSETDRVVAMPFINTQWLKTLGLEMPTNWDELLTVLRAFRDQDPNQNGIADEIPMIGSNTLYCADAPSWIMNNFGEYVYDAYLMTYDENGKIDVPYTTETYREGLRQIKKLVDEGLLPVQTWTLKEGAELKNLWTPAEGEPKVGVVFGYPTSYAEKGDPDIFQYEVLPAFEGSYVPLRAMSVGKNFFISSDCTNFDLAAEFLMSFCDLEVARSSRHGEEGVDWYEDIDIRSGKPMIRKVEGHDIYNNPGNRTWGENGPVVGWYGNADEGSPWRVGEFEIDEDDTEDAAGYRGGLLGKQMTINLAYAKENNPKLFYNAIYNVEETEENGDSLANLKTYVKEARAKFATGMLDPDSETDWNNYLNTLETLGLSTLVKNTQAAVDRGTAKVD